MKTPEELLDQHQRHPNGQHDGWWECLCGSPHDSQHLVEVLGLFEERRTNAMSSAGQTTNSKTGVTTFHSDIRYDHRWVTSWSRA